VLTIDKTTLLRRIQEDPGLALRLVERLCRRIRTERGAAPEEIAPPDVVAGVADKTLSEPVVAVEN